MSIETDTGPQMGSVPYEPPTASASEQIGGNSNTPQTEASSQSMLSRAFKAFAVYFDVDTADVAERAALSFNPLVTKPFLTNGMVDTENARNPGSILNGKRPDLWGPVWILVSAVLTSSVAKDFHLIYSYSRQPPNLLMVYRFVYILGIFGILVPLGAFMVAQHELLPTLTLAQTFCLYGYSFTAWIPAILVAGSPLGDHNVIDGTAAIIVRIVSFALASVFSAMFIYGNFYKVMAARASDASTVDKTKMTAFLLIGVLIQAALGLILFTQISP